MFIYKITNITNKKVYIGKTEMNSVRKRFLYHLQDLRKNRHCNRHLQASFNLHGEKCLKFEVIDSALDKEKLSEKEINYITLYLSCDDRFGYNLTKGGDGITGWKATPETIKRMSESKKGLLAGEKHPNFGKKMSDEHKEKLRIANLKRTHAKGKDSPKFGIKNPKHSLFMTGRKLSKEHCQKISLSKKGKNKGISLPLETLEKSVAKRRKKIIGTNVATNEKLEFQSITDASKYLSANKSNIVQVCLGHRETCKGWRFEYLNEPRRVNL